MKKLISIRDANKRALVIAASGLALTTIVYSAMGAQAPANAEAGTQKPHSGAVKKGMTDRSPGGPAYAKWFRHGDGVTVNWSIQEDVGNAYRLTIRRRSVNTAKPTRRVFVLYPRPSSAYDMAITKILDVFEEKDINAEFTIVNFQNKGAQGRGAIKEAENEKHDLIFTMGSQSTAWVHANYRGNRIPVVSVCSKDPVILGQTKGYDQGSGRNFAYTSLNMPIDAQMAYVLELKPNLKNIGVLVNSKNVSAVKTQAKPIERYARRRGIRVLYLAIDDPKKARAQLGGLVSRAVSSMRKNDPTLDNSVFWVTGSTAVFREIATINANSDRVPVMSVVPDVVKEGDDSAVLSVGIGFESNAHLAAIYGADIVSGRAKAGELPVGVVSPPDIAINFRKAREIGLKVPFRFFESAAFVYDYDGHTVRYNGKRVAAKRGQQIN